MISITKIGKRKNKLKITFKCNKRERPKRETYLRELVNFPFQMVVEPNGEDTFWFYPKLESIRKLNWVTLFENPKVIINKNPIQGIFKPLETDDRVFDLEELSCSPFWEKLYPDLFQEFKNYDINGNTYKLVSRLDLLYRRVK